jgi:chromosome segregation ATPase
LHTDKELSLNLKQFRTTINQLGVLSQTLSTKIEGLNSRFDDMEHGLENMEHRMESLENSMVKLYQGTESLEASFKTVNGYLLEVIRREQMVMQELGELASR